MAGGRGSDLDWLFADWLVPTFELLKQTFSRPPSAGQ